MSLLNDHQKQAKAHLLKTEPFEDAFGPKRKRKSPKILATDYESLLKKADGSQDAYEEKTAANPSIDGGEVDGLRDLVRHNMFEKGQSKRIWGELYKVVDSSDVVVQVLDARDPQGTRCYHLKRHLKEHSMHKHMILLLNKCDLVPAWATKGWLRVLSNDAAGPHTVDKGKEVVNFASSNYLRLIGHEKLIKSCTDALDKYGVDSCGPRGFYGTIDVHLDCEAKIAKFMGTPDSILYSFGISTMFSAIPAFCKKGDIIVVDDGVHWGIQNGLHLSRSTIVYFKHNDMQSLEKTLEKITRENKRASKMRRYIVVEAVYQVKDLSSRCIGSCPRLCNLEDLPPFSKPNLTLCVFF